MKRISNSEIWVSVLALVFLLGTGSVKADIPKETYEALGISKSASPKQLYDKLTERYLDPAQGAGKGSHAQYWEPIAMSAYL
ncbi:MAG: hypothetical protein V1246_05890, partial [Arenicellales bacterium]|nr:hypothetical protein [Arenicellales bacterium]